MINKLIAIIIAVGMLFGLAYMDSFHISSPKVLMNFLLMSGLVVGGYFLTLFFAAEEPIGRKKSKEAESHREEETYEHRHAA